MATSSPPPVNIIRPRRVATVSMVKNECDIIELFIRINARQVDAMLLLDHNSSDATAQIIQACQREFPHVHYRTLDDAQFDQAAITMRWAQGLARGGEFDYIIPLDADEFLQCTQPGATIAEHLASRLGPDQASRIQWRTFCPIATDYFDTPAPLHACFRQRTVEQPLYHKVVMGNEYAKGCVLSQGNHGCNHAQFGPASVALDMVVQHVPVRSAAQITRKALLGRNALRWRPNAKPEEGAHWQAIADCARKAGWQLDARTLFNIAHSYPSTHIGDSDPQAHSMDAPRVGTAQDVMRFPELARIDLVDTLDRELQRLTDVLTRHA